MEAMGRAIQTVLVKGELCWSLGGCVQEGTQTSQSWPHDFRYISFKKSHFWITEHKNDLSGYFRIPAEIVHNTATLAVYKRITTYRGALVLAHFSIKSQRITICSLKNPCGFCPSYLLVTIHCNWQLDTTHNALERVSRRDRLHCVGLQTCL